MSNNDSPYTFYVYETMRSAIVIFLLLSASYLSASETEQMIPSFLLNHSLDSLNNDLDPFRPFLEGKIGEELTEMIVDADSVFASVTTMKNEEAYGNSKLNRDQTHLVKYTMCQAYMYKSDQKVYGQFSEFARFSFYYQGNIAIVSFDYGLQKWKVKIADCEKEFRFDMPEYQMMPLFYLLFPKSELLKVLYENYYQEQ